MKKLEEIKRLLADASALVQGDMVDWYFEEYDGAHCLGDCVSVYLGDNGAYRFLKIVEESPKIIARLVEEVELLRKLKALVYVGDNYTLREIMREYKEAGFE